MVLACRSAPSPTPTVTPTPDVPVASDAATATTDAAPASAWASLSREDLGRLVTEAARTRVREAQPDLDLTRLAEYRARPEASPAIAGRAVDHLFNLAVVALSQGRLDEAEGIIRLVRARARNRNLAFAGTTLLAETRRRLAGEAPAAQQSAVEAVFRELPRARFGSATVVFQLFQNQGQLDARLGEVHGQLVAGPTARDALWYGEVMPGVVRARATFLAAIDAVRAQHAAAPAARDYPFGRVDMTGAGDAGPVRVGVWDLGTSPTLFSRQLYVNAGDAADGQDNDHDGLVDDVSGVVSDGAAPHTALLYEPPAALLARYSPFLRGVMDLRAGMASTEAARRVLELQREATTPEAAHTLDQNLDAIGEWAHGTHVAGILLRQLPTARLAVFRSAWAGEARPYDQRGPTDEELSAERANIEQIAGFINRHRVRVVNASLGFSIEYVEDALRHERERYHSEDEVRARARAVQARRRENWQWIFEHCPDTLFVVAAGNSNQDVVEYEVVPAANQSPNLLVVGAVDRFGAWATFTNSNPERVRVFAHGVEVDSLVPSGDTVPLSGTSMASPNAASAAARLFALDPAMTPARAITVLQETGDPIAAPFNGSIVNEVRAVGRVRRERGRAPFSGRQ